MRNLFLVVFITAFAGLQMASAQTIVDAAKVEALLKENPAFQLVDLRTPGELQQTGKIKGARHIDFNGQDFQSKIAKLDKSQPVIVYCAAGGRSAAASTQMKNMGFKKIYDYKGGMMDWSSRGKKTVH